MIKKILMGFVWAVFFYFLFCTVVGGVAGGIAGQKDPQNAAEAGSRAGGKAVKDLMLFIVVGSISLAGCGAFFEVLPGTKSKG